MLKVRPPVAGEGNISTVEKLESKTYVMETKTIQGMPVHPAERTLHAQRESKLSVDVGALRMSLLRDELIYLICFVHINW